MYGVLDLRWKPTAQAPTPPAGQAPGIVRNDTYAHTIRITDGVVNGYDDFTWTAQIRRARLTGTTAGDAIAAFSVVEEADGDDLLLHLGLTSVVTTALPAAMSTSDYFWDLQGVNGSTVVTLLHGKVKVLDDVTRAA